MTLNDLTYLIRGAIFTVYNELGPGLLESVYQKALYWELNQLGLSTEKEKPIKYYFKVRTLEWVLKQT